MTADSGYLAKQLMAGMQTEVVGDAGTDCGTKKTIDFILDEHDAKDLTYRYINEGGKPTLIKHDNIGKYIGKRIKLFSPMCCSGVNGKICEKCAGKLDSKFVGLDSNAVATTLTNLNMKKFHDSTIRLYAIDPNDILINHSKDICTNDGTNIILTDDYFEMYIPTSYFDKLGLAEDMGNKINLFGLITVGIFNNGKFDHFDTWNIPSYHNYNTFDTELREIEIPGMGKTLCKVLKYLKGHQICPSNIIEDALNAQLFLRQVTYGKVPNTIPYTASLTVWKKNQKMNNVSFGVPSVILEVILATMYRYKKDPNMKFASVFGKDPNVSEYDYEMGSIRRICQVNSTFTGITFESFDDMVTTSVNRARNKGNETESPLEMLFKL